MKTVSRILVILSLIGFCGCSRQTASVTTGAPIKIETGSTTTATRAPETTAAPTETSTEAPTTTRDPNQPSVISFGKTTRAPETETTRSSVFEESDLSFLYQGVTIRLCEDFAPAKAQLELPCTEAKGQACIGGGFDISYYYGENPAAPEFSVLTLGDSGKQVVYDIFVEGTGMGTQKGAVIGTSTREEVMGLYGAPTASRGATDQYSLDGKLLLAFTYTNNVLSSFDYLDTTAGNP